MSFLFIFVLFSSQFKLVNLLWSHMVQDPFLPLQVFLGVIVCDSSSERKKLPIFYSDHASDSGKVLFLPTAEWRSSLALPFCFAASKRSVDDRPFKSLSLNLENNFIDVL